MTHNTKCLPKSYAIAIHSAHSARTATPAFVARMAHMPHLKDALRPWTSLGPAALFFVRFGVLDCQYCEPFRCLPTQ